MQFSGRPAFQQHGQAALSPSFHLWRRGPQPPGPRPPRPAPRRPSSTAAVALHHHVLLLTAVEAAQHSAPSPPSTAATAAAVPGSHGRVPLNWRRRRGVPAVIGATLTRGMRLLLLLEFFTKIFIFYFLPDPSEVSHEGISGGARHEAPAAAPSSGACCRRRRRSRRGEFHL